MYRWRMDWQYILEFCHHKYTIRDAIAILSNNINLIEWLPSATLGSGIALGGFYSLNGIYGLSYTDWWIATMRCCVYLVTYN